LTKSNNVHMVLGVFFLVIVVYQEFPTDSLRNDLFVLKSGRILKNTILEESAHFDAKKTCLGILLWENPNFGRGGTKI